MKPRFFTCAKILAARDRKPAPPKPPKPEPTIYDNLAKMPHWSDGKPSTPKRSA